MQVKMRPGMTVPVSGQYTIAHPSGAKIGKIESIMVKGSKTPPTPKPKQVFVSTDKTKHKK
jgi:hypothetical protein